MCSACTFLKKSRLYYHKKATHEGRIFSCPECLKELKSSNGLKIHLNSFHKSIKDIFECSNCSKPFSSNSHLRRHINAVHEKKKPYKCNKCPKGFITKDHLKR